MTHAVKSLDLLPASFDDYRRRAERRLPRTLFDYVDGGAGAETTLQANVRAFEAVRLRQRVGIDIAKIDTRVDLLGERFDLPLLLGPVGMAGMMARRGEATAKRVADRFGIGMTLSISSICPLAEVAAGSARPLWFQLYMLRDRGVVREILDHAARHGVTTLVLTVDLNALGSRRRDTRNAFHGGAGMWGRVRSGAIDYLLHPRWAWSVGLRGQPHGFGNLARYAPAARSPADFKHWADALFDASVGWSDIEWLRGVWAGKIVVKGVLDRQDALAATQAGADALIVSNHGGRQLDGVATTAEALPAIADALGGTHPLIVDSGIRSGQDIVRALALGADAAMIARPWVMALAADGDRGLTRMLEQFRQEMRIALGLSGHVEARAVGRTALLDPPNATCSPGTGTRRR